ncbi:MAG: hypothetical protein ACI9VR_000123 [Cognaticolwellia sp.]
MPALTLTDGNCYTESTDSVNFSDRPSSYQVAGIDGSRMPGNSSVKARKVGGFCSPAATDFRTPGNAALAADETWTSAPGGVSAGGETYNFLECESTGGASPGSGTCANSCDGTYAVEIIPEATIACDAYDNIRLELPTDDGSERKKTSASACTSGNGTFKLLPLSWGDSDNDGDKHMRLLPVMTSGTGTPHRQSWVTRVDLPDDEGYSLYVVKSGQRLAYDDADQLVSAASSTFGIAEGTNTYTTGVIDGFPIFGVSDMDVADAAAFEVDMWWTCGGPADVITKPTGYVVDLDAIGCGVDQELVLRKHSSPNRITLEPYGAPSEKIGSPLVPVAGGERFTHRRGELEIEVKITSTTPTAMTATIEELSFEGLNVCTAGTYTFPVQ